MEGEKNNEVVLIAEVEKLYPDEWLLFEVVETDEMNRPIKGRLLAHSPDYDYVKYKLLEAECYHTYLYYNGEVNMPVILTT
ncbi:MAG: hypothetical protein ACUVV0_10950 [Anaerolineae bacterium]